MKTTLVAVAFSALASLAQASTAVATCVPAPVTYVGQSGGGNEVCTFIGLPVGPIIVNTIQLTTVFDAVYDGFADGLETVVVSYNLDGPGSLDTSGSVMYPDGSDLQLTGLLTCANVGTFCANPSASFNIVDSYSGTNDALTGATFNKRVTIDYTPGVPEPSTYAMMGMGLVGLYMARRKA